MKFDDNSATCRTLALVGNLMLLEEAEAAAEAYFRLHYPATAVKGKAGTVLKGSRWGFAQALHALALRGHGSLTQIGAIVGVAHQHVGNLYTRLDSARD